MAATLPEAPRELALTRDEPLARHTYMRIGGPAAYFGTPTDVDALRRIVTWARRARLPLRVIGGGSNVLVSDEGVTAVVLSLRAACGAIRFDGPLVTAGAAVMLPRLAHAAAEQALGGLEFAIGIPGAVGGALQTNAGIGDGRAIGPLVRTVDVLRLVGDVLTRVTLPANEITWGYRETSLRGSGDLVLGATLELSPRPRAEIEAEMRRLLDARQASQPTATPNAGSTFCNPPGDYAGRVIEAAGCTGLAVGAARISELHANFVVHDGSARAADVAALMAEVQTRVRVASGVTLVPEIEWWGDGPPPAAFAVAG
ncbi:MAG: UDP-N-acetylmuramate dehydrogenase [Chloroflexi bacterium]|nr:UDP-N-acetylmuramate dehydrogenase [Chloroflexota bacterium]MDA1003132.1 UDP-N-acetylmuramate dehydrogenase [Chloroflexota bacterium]